MRVLYVIGELTTGGAETALLRLVSRAKIEPMVVSLKPIANSYIADQMRSAGITVCGLNLSRSPSASLIFPQLRRIVNRFRPNIVHGWMYYGNMFASLSLLKVPVIWSIRQSIYDFRCDSWMRRTIIRLCAKLSSQPAAIVYNSEIAMEQHRSLGFNPSSQVFIPNGFDCEQFRPNPEVRTRLRAGLNIRDSTVLIGLIARFDPYKDHATFITAAAIVAKQNRDAYFLMAGRDVNESNFELMRLIAAHGLKNRVFLLGLRTDIPDITAALDIACSSSISEGFPNVIGEAMASGVPCVATKVGESRNLISNTGIIVPPQDPNSMADALMKIINEGPFIRKCRGVSARERIEQNFSLDFSVREHERIYSNL